jgi:hypothetical protein
MLSQGNETKVLTDPAGTKLFLKVATLSLGHDTSGLKKIFYTIAYEGNTFLVANPLAVKQPTLFDERFAIEFKQSESVVF